LMPYQSFIPNYSHLFDWYFWRMGPDAAFRALVKELGRMYFVGEMTVEYRINSLKGEIGQYLDGVAVEDILVLSGRK